MNSINAKAPFDTLLVPVMQLKDWQDNRYRVYKTAEEFIELSAPTAQEALAASGITQPYKILHVVKDLTRIVESAKLVKLANSNSL